MPINSDAFQRCASGVGERHRNDRFFIFFTSEDFRRFYCASHPDQLLQFARCLHDRHTRLGLTEQSQFSCLGIGLAGIGCLRQGSNPQNGPGIHTGLHRQLVNAHQQIQLFQGFQHLGFRIDMANTFADFLRAPGKEFSQFDGCCLLHHPQCILAGSGRKRMDLTQIVEQFLLRLFTHAERAGQRGHRVKYAHREHIFLRGIDDDDALVDPRLISIIQIIPDQGRTQTQH
ncbi:hypothetical protein D3C72_462060 [compost metagenome]